MNQKLFFFAFILFVAVALTVWWITPASISSDSTGQAVAAETQSSEQQAASAAEPWSVRCQEEPKHCEIVQRLIVKESGQRFAEVAIGYPEESSQARGVMILPLGVLLEEGVVMKIDDGAMYQFNFRYCAAQGCVAVIQLNDELIAELKKGSQATLQFKNLNGQDLNLPITLKGFTSAINQLS